MKDHTQAAPNTNHGSLETHTKGEVKERAKPGPKPKSKQDELHEFETKISRATISGIKEIETSENIIDYFMQSEANKQGFKDCGFFLYKGVKVSLLK